RGVRLQLVPALVLRAERGHAGRRDAVVHREPDDALELVAFDAADLGPDLPADQLVRRASEEPLRLAVDVDEAPLRVEREEPFGDALEDLGRAQITLRRDALGDIHARREHELDDARFVLDRQTREVDDPLLAIAAEIHRDAAERLAADCPPDGILHPFLKLRRAVPPSALPERLADDLLPGDAGLLEQRSVRVDQRAVERDARRV